MTIAAALQKAIETEIGRTILGVSIGLWDDRSTWRIDFAPDATEKERQAAQAVLDSFDPAAVPETQPKNVDEVAADIAALKVALVGKGMVTEAEVHAGREARVHES